jgi:hypothetical protein
LIINAPGILAALLALGEIAAGIAILWVVGPGLRSADRTAEGVVGRESLRHLLLLLVLLVATLSAVSLFLWMLLLQSYVPQWFGVRCIVGVLRVGTGSEGAPGWLPALALATSGLRGALLFAAGAGVVLHLVGRDRQPGEISRRHRGALAVVGLLAVASAATEVAYIVVPKQAQHLASGCCSAAPPMVVDDVQNPLASGEAGAITGLYVACAMALSIALAVWLRREGGRRILGDVLRVGGGSILLISGLRFVADVIAPARLGLPLHRCTFCLTAEAPETLVGLALLVVPALAAGWRATARWLGPAAGSSAAGLGRSLDRTALFGALGSLVFFSGEWLAT